MTAAPRTICASLVDDLPRSRSTRAVIPTLVAERLAPRNMWTGQGLRGRRTAPAPQPRIIGAITPRTATRKAEGPTRRKSARLASSPTWKSSMMIPIRARCSIEIPAWRNWSWSMRGTGMRLVDLQEVEPVVAEDREVPEQHADDQLAEHRGLPRHLEEMAADPRGEDDHDHPQEDGGDGVGLAAFRLRSSATWRPAGSIAGATTVGPTLDVRTQVPREPVPGTRGPESAQGRSRGPRRGAIVRITPRDAPPGGCTAGKWCSASWAGPHEFRHRQ